MFVFKQIMAIPLFFIMSIVLGCISLFGSIGYWIIKGRDPGEWDVRVAHFRVKLYNWYWRRKKI
jgi:hypothetical protein